MRKILSAVLIAALLLCLMPAAQAASDGMIRVKLTRVGTPSSLTFTVNCNYSCADGAGMNIPSGSTVTVSASGGNLSMTCGDRTVSCGSSAHILRCSGGSKGARFTSPSVGNIYCGDLILSASGSSITTVLEIYIEQYLYGVVGYEMSNNYPAAALEAQAVVARNFALKRKTAKPSASYHVTDTSNDQVFKGYNSSYGRVIAAVDDTRGQVLYYGGSLASCYYSASNGGQTESTANAWGSKLAYSTVKDDPYDLANASARKKSARIAKDGSGLNASLESALTSAAAAKLGSGVSMITVDKITSVEAVEPRYAAPSKLYTKLRIGFSASGTTSGGDIRTAACTADVLTYGAFESWYDLSINSGSNETVAVTESQDAFTVTFRRSGHGIGLSQRGAQTMAADHGMSAASILGFYFPGTVLMTQSLSETVSGGLVIEQRVDATPEPTESPSPEPTDTPQPTDTPAPDVTETPEPDVTVIFGTDEEAQSTPVPPGDFGDFSFTGDTDYDAMSSEADEFEEALKDSEGFSLNDEGEDVPNFDEDEDEEEELPDDTAEFEEALKDSEGFGSNAEGEDVPIFDEDEDEEEELPDDTAEFEEALKDSKGFGLNSKGEDVPIFDEDEDDEELPDDTAEFEEALKDSEGFGLNTSGTDVPVFGDDDDEEEGFDSGDTDETFSDPTEGMKRPKGTVYGYVDVSSDSTLTLRAYPSADSAALRALRRGTAVQVLAYNTKWANVKLKSGQTGFVSVRYLSHEPVDDESKVYDVEKLPAKESGVTVCEIKAKTTRNVAVFSAASRDSDKIARIDTGKTVTVLAYNDEWAYVSGGTKKGFVLLKYLRRV